MLVLEFGVVIVLGGGMLVARELFRIQFHEKRKEREAKAKRAYILSRSNDDGKEWTVDGVRYRVAAGRLQWANVEAKMWERV